ncbi:hypothetical protein HDU76_006162, partial [Blyttiomyces sp. JEL0837]
MAPTTEMPSARGPVGNDHVYHTNNQTPRPAKVNAITPSPATPSSSNRSLAYQSPSPSPMTPNPTSTRRQLQNQNLTYVHTNSPPRQQSLPQGQGGMGMSQRAPYHVSAAAAMATSRINGTTTAKVHAVSTEVLNDGNLHHTIIVKQQRTYTPPGPRNASIRNHPNNTPVVPIQLPAPLPRTLSLPRSQHPSQHHHNQRQRSPSPSPQQRQPPRPRNPTPNQYNQRMRNQDLFIDSSNSPTSPGPKPRVSSPLVASHVASTISSESNDANSSESNTSGGVSLSSMRKTPPEMYRVEPVPVPMPTMSNQHQQQRQQQQQQRRDQVQEQGQQRPVKAIKPSQTLVQTQMLLDELDEQMWETIEEEAASVSSRYVRGSLKKMKNNNKGSNGSSSPGVGAGERVTTPVMESVLMKGVNVSGGIQVSAGTSSSGGSSSNLDWDYSPIVGNRRGSFDSSVDSDVVVPPMITHASSTTTPMTPVVPSTPMSPMIPTTPITPTTPMTPTTPKASTRPPILPRGKSMIMNKDFSSQFQFVSPVQQQTVGSPVTAMPQKPVSAMPQTPVTPMAQSQIPTPATSGVNPVKPTPTQSQQQSTSVSPSPQSPSPSQLSTPV